jgi:hypothetical protein
MQLPDVQLVTFVCIAAFLAVFLLLVILALAMRLLIAVFPEKVARSDPALVAAVTTAVSAAYPGMHVTKVEEEK